MNEQIEHCLYKSGLTAQGCWDELDDYARECIEKFAELIVKECQTRVEQYICDCGEIGSLPDAVIMKHFGVEE